MKSNTIIYYTANREDPAFEQKIIDNIKANRGDVPVISVSQKPLDFGENICVGDVGFSYQNEFRQIYLGAKKATTPFIIFTESDVLYPPDYFKFVPPNENDCYRNDNVWMVWNDGSKYAYHKRYSDGATICGRELFIREFEKFYAEFPEWSVGKPLKRKGPLSRYQRTMFSSQPCISFKTGNGMAWSATIINEEQPQETLPYWGSVEKLKQEYLCG